MGIVVEEPFSDEVVCKAIEKWLQGRGYEFEMKMVPFKQARGSRLIKKLAESDSEEGAAVSIESLERELAEAETKRRVEFIANVTEILRDMALGICHFFLQRQKGL